MTEDEAERAVSHLVGGLNGFTNPATVVEYTEQLADLPDADALEDVCRELVRTWPHSWKPNVRDIRDAYRDHPTVRREREDRINRSLAESATTTLCDSGWVVEGTGRRPCPRCNPLLHEIWMVPDKWTRYLNGTSIGHLVEIDKDFVMPQTCKLDTHHDREVVLPPTTEGRLIASEAYEAAYGRKMGERPTPDPVCAEAIFVEIGQLDRHGNRTAMFVDVLAKFGGDYGTANASLNALGRRLTSALNGMLTLTPVPEASEIVYEPRTGLWASSLPPRPAEGAVDPAGMMAALAETAARFTDDDVL